MTKKILIFLAAVILIPSISQVFAEVSQLELDRELYFNDDTIYLSGHVSDESSGLVTIVVRDPGNNFVLMDQAVIQSNKMFEKNIPINSKFQSSGSYSVTAFVFNMTEAKTKSFDILLDYPNTSIKPTETKNIEKDYSMEPQLTENGLESKAVDPNFDFKLTYEQTIPFTSNESKIADFVDPQKPPTYYLDRYYNEPKYKSWFDRNYPNLTIEEAVGYKGPKYDSGVDNSFNHGIIPKAEAASIESSSIDYNKDIALSILVVAGLAILFAAVYGIKIKSEKKSRKIPKIKIGFRQKLFPKISNPHPAEIIQTRLARGEITIEEYEKIKEKLE